MKAYCICKQQAEEIDEQINSGNVIDAVKDLLLDAKREFEEHCRIVQIIMAHVPAGSTARRILSLRYEKGMSMKDIANTIGYSVGYCDNVESSAIESLCGKTEIMDMLQKL